MVFIPPGVVLLFSLEIWHMVLILNSQHIETLSHRHHTIETVSVPRTRKYKKHPNQSKSNNLIDVQQIKNRYNRDKQTIKLGLVLDHFLQKQICK